MKKIDIVLLIVYVVVGIVILTTDPLVAPIYLTVLPLQYFYLKLALKTNNLFFILLAVCFLLSHGIGSVTFYLNRAEEYPIGFNAIGNFDFSYARFFQAYSYIFVFQLVLLAVFFQQRRSWHQNYLTPFVKQEIKYYSSVKRPYGILPILCLTLLFSAVSLWMYNLHIGMIGLKQVSLPYHLTGILFNLRRYVFPLILLFIFIRTDNQVLAAILIVCYSFVAGVSGTSKSLSLILLLPTIFLCYLSNHKRTAALVGAATVILYVFVDDARFLIFISDAEIPIRDAVAQSIELLFSKNPLDFLFGFIDAICNRLYGIRSTVLTDQHSLTDAGCLVDFYLKLKDINEIIPNIPYNVYGINLPDDKAYGVCFGYNGTYQLLCCHNYLLAVLQALLIALVAGWQNRLLQRTFILYDNRWSKYIMLLASLMTFYAFLPGHNMRIFYLMTVFMFFYFKVFMPKYRIVPTLRPLAK